MTQRRWVALSTVILFGAFALRLWNLGSQSLWHDEAWSIYSAYHPFQIGDPNTPMLFHDLLAAWMLLVGDGVWALRFWSLILGVLLVAVAAAITRRWFGPRAAIIASILVAISPSLWVFSQELRPYIAVPLLTLGLLVAADAVLRARGPVPRQIWLWLIVIEAVFLYTHNLSVPVVAWLNVTVLVVLAFRREWRRILTWLLIQAGLFVLYLPWLVTQQPTGTPLNTPPAIALALPWDIWQSYFTGVKAMLGADRDLMALTAAVGILALGALIAVVMYRRTGRTLLVMSQVILVPVFEVIIISAAHIDFHPRYFVASIPATLMLLAVGLDTLRRKRLLAPLALAGAVLIAVGTTARMITVMYSSPVYQHDDFRSIAQRYAQLGPDDAIIIPYGWDPTVDYYSRKLNFKARIIGIPLHSDAQTIVEQLQAALWDRLTPRAELLTWYQLPADVRGAYPCLLGATGTLSESLTVSGLKSDTYTGFLPPRVATSDAAADYQQVRLTGLDQVGRTGDRTCLITHWLLPQQTSENWRLTLRALNPLEATIAQADTDLLNRNELPTSLWKAGQAETAFSLLNLPDAAPPDSYRVMAGVYSDQTPNGLDALEDGRAVGRQVTIGAVKRWFAYAATAQPTAADLDLGDGLYLHQKDLTAGPLQSGQRLRLSFEWWQAGDVHSLKARRVLVSLEGQDWRVSTQVPVLPAAKDLTWDMLTVPANAQGKAMLKVTTPDNRSTPVADYEIQHVDRVFAEPVVQTRLDGADFTGVGSLVGFTVSVARMNRQEWRYVTLLWRADDASSTAYTVFVHLLDDKGQLVAQNDSQPAGGSRPTTTWVKGEYLFDNHDLGFQSQNYSSPLTIEVGLYDATTGKRVSLSNGSDRIVLPGEF